VEEVNWGSYTVYHCREISFVLPSKLPRGSLPAYLPVSSVRTVIHKYKCVVL
jgi:hypothetical protein